MKTKITLTKKTPLEKIKEIIPISKIYVKREHGIITVFLGKPLTVSQIRKIKDLFMENYYVVVEEVENFPRAGGLKID